jgi:hypothetical protein
MDETSYTAFLSQRNNTPPHLRAHYAGPAGPALARLCRPSNAA